MKTISARIPEALDARLTIRSEESGTPKSELIRQALEHFLNTTDDEPSAYEMASDLCGVLTEGARDLSTNRAYLEGFGE